MYEIEKYESPDPFVRLIRECVQDPSLSLKAKGLLMLMLSFPDDWMFRQDDLVSMSTDGVSSFRSGMEELIESGHVMRWRGRDENGHLGHYQYRVSDRPIFKDDDATRFENRILGALDSNFQAREIASHIKNYYEEEEEARSRAGRITPNRFAKWWKEATGKPWGGDGSRMSFVMGHEDHEIMRALAMTHTSDYKNWRYFKRVLSEDNDGE